MNNISKARKDMIDLEAITRNLEENYQPPVIELTNYEKAQEESAVISYEELLKRKNTNVVNYDDSYVNETNVEVKKIDLRDNIEPTTMEIMNTKVEVRLFDYEKEEALHIDLTSDEKKIFELSYGSVSEMNSDTEETITNFALTFRDEQDKASKIEVEFKVVADLQPKVGKVVVKNIISYDKVTQADVDGIVNKIFNYGTFGKYVKNKYDEAQAQIPSEPSYDVNYEDDLLDSGDNELDLNNPTIEIG